MEQSKIQHNEELPMTREDLMRRLKEHRRKKQEYIRMMEDYLRAEYKKRTGQEPGSIEVW